MFWETSHRNISVFPLLSPDLFVTQSPEKETELFVLQGKYLMVSTETPINFRALSGPGARFSWQVSEPKGETPPGKGKGGCAHPSPLRWGGHLHLSPLLCKKAIPCLRTDRICFFIVWFLLKWWKQENWWLRAQRVLGGHFQSKQGPGFPEMVTVCLQALTERVSNRA